MVMELSPFRTVISRIMNPLIRNSVSSIPFILMASIPLEALHAESGVGFFVFAASGWVLTAFLLVFSIILFMMKNRKSQARGGLSGSNVNEEISHDLVDHMLDGLIATCDDMIDYMNPAALKMLSIRDPSEYTNKRLFDFVLPEEQSILREFFHRLKGTDGGGEIEARMVPLDGEIIHVIFHTVMVPSHHCDRYCVTTIKNITLRRKLETDLHESEVIHREIIDTTREGYILLNREFRIQDYNRALMELLEVDGAWLGGRSIMDLAEKDMVIALSQKLRNLEKVLHESFDTVFLKRNGDPIYLRVSASILPDSSRDNVIFLFLTDLTPHRQTLDAIKEQERRIRELNERNEMILQSAGEGIFGIDGTGTIAFANQAALEMLQLTPEEFLHHNDHELIHHTKIDGSPFPASECPIHNVLRTGQVRVVPDDLFWRKDGTSFPVEYTASPIDELGRTTGVVVVFRDISGRKESEREQQLTRALFETTAEAMMITDGEMRILSINPAFTRVTGFQEREVIGKDPRILKSGRHSPDFYQDMWEELLFNGHWKGEIWNRRKNGELYVQRLTISAIRDRDNRISNFVSVFSDITEEKKEEAETEYRATHDALTGLPNRTLLMDRLHGAITLAHRKAESVAIFFLDLDGFKPVNDNHGHVTGDLLLQEVANRLQHHIRESDTIARHGGDEFVVIAEIEKDNIRESVQRIGKRIEAVFEEEFQINKLIFHVGCSIGVSVYPDHGKEVNVLLDLADRAMYEVKRGARANGYIYDPGDFD